MKRYLFQWLAALLIALTAVLSVVAYLFLGVDFEAEQKKNELLAEMVNATVLEELSGPMTVSRMISQDGKLQELLLEEVQYSQEDMVQRMRAYLQPIREKFEFSSVYVISEKTKRYYSYIGLNKVIDPETNSFDTWYSLFINQGKDYEFESSTDEANRDRMTIFVDGRVENREGDLLGVSGVGVELETLYGILSKFEQEHGVMIDYISADALVQISSRLNAVHSSYVSGVVLPENTDESYHYQTYGVDGFAVVKYVPELGWYLVVRSEHAYGAGRYNYRFFFAELLLLIVMLSLLYAFSRNLKGEMVYASRNQNVDSVTGLPNRDYLFRVYGEHGTLNTIQYQSIAEFSIDGFDDVERSPGSDRILFSVVRTAREIFGKQGQIMRWNRSSFVVLFELPVEEAESACRKFCKAVEEIGDVTVSIGLTQIELNETLKKNYYRAVQHMYLVKELGGNNVKRG
ncbi:MAG: diguanylate cyclase [Lachnospiraceae bacterium]|nr:diguanylate cyclase [Lachnospiraceae bacterium]